MTQTTEARVRARGYLVVFGALLVLTILTVVAASLHFPTLLAVAIGVAIATAKASLVALFFMHLIHEHGAVYLTLAFTAVFCAALFGLTIWTEADHVPGTQFRTPFL